jgi:glycerophosphoryl diester phosphodiesterase
MAVVDSAMAYVPRPYVPGADSVARAKIIAHRGAHKPPFGSGSEILENTMLAFQRAVDTGSWGLELDLRWTSDDVPVIHHDRDCGRLFKKSVTIHRVTQKKLRESVEHIPTLEEFVNAFKGKAHFMIEIKKGRALLGKGGKFWTQKKIDILAGHLSDLEPQRDYHLIGLKPKLLLDCKFVPREAMVAVAEWNMHSMSEFALKHGFGGVAGHYLLLTNAIIERHLKAGQKVGSGFPTSRSVLVRELNRGIEWIFTNHAPQIAEELRSLRPT